MNKKNTKPIDLRFVEEKDWETFLQEGGTLSDALAIDKKSLEGIYSIAYTKYQNASFKEALTLFKLLCQCNHLESKYFLGLGAAQQALNQFKQAGETYSFAAMVYPNEPRFPFYAAQCHLALGNWKFAGSGYEMTVYLCEKNAIFPHLKEQAQHQVNILAEKLKKSLQTESVL